MQHMSGKFETAPDINITEEGILELLMGLNPNKAAGPDHISPKVLKRVAGNGLSI